MALFPFFFSWPLLPDYDRIREKINAINLLEMSLNMQDKDTVVELLHKIQVNFPSTGTYFMEDSQWMLDQIKDQ